MTTPVKFELAKLLKEKRFNIPCRYQYYKWLGKYEILDNEEDATNEELSIQAKNDGISLDTWITAPTFAEVVMWLYEKHGIWIYAISPSKTSWYYNIESLNESFNKETKSGYNSPTEAYEAAIEQSLIKLI